MATPDGSSSDAYDPTYVDDALYATIAVELSAWRADDRPGDDSLRTESETFLFGEARLLDDRRYDDWLDLFTQDCVYWVPFNPAGGDPRTELSFTFDDRRRLVDRVIRLNTGWAHSQTPPSRTVRAVSNVEAWPLSAEERRVRSTTVIWEYRRDMLRPLPATVDYRLRRDGGVWRIRWKIVRLVHAEAALKQLSIVL